MARVFGLPLRQRLEHATGVVRVRHVIRERARLGFQQSALAAVHDAVRRGRFPQAPLMKEVRTEQGAFGFFEENTGVPAMGHVGRGNKPEAVAAGLQNVISRQHPSRADRKIIHAHHGANEAADGLGALCRFEPVVQSLHIHRIRND